MADDTEHVHELQQRGFCVLRGRLPAPLVDACRHAFWPVLLAYLANHGDEPNRGPHRHFLPMPFTPPCFTPQFFFNDDVLRVVRRTLGERIVADQWGCDAPVRGSMCGGGTRMRAETSSRFRRGFGSH